MKKVTRILFAALCIIIGLYPLMYLSKGLDFFAENGVGLLSTKTPGVLNHSLWRTAFYGHIIFGGIALLIGWMQFPEKFRARFLPWHRKTGVAYLLSVLLSGSCGIYLGFYATGGFISAAGFISLGGVWLYTTLSAFTAVKRGAIHDHRDFMTYSYAACFAAVTLRIWLPLLSATLGGFDTAYPIVAWLCWVPNLGIAYLIVKRNRRTETRRVSGITD